MQVGVQLGVPEPPAYTKAGPLAGVFFAVTNSRSLTVNGIGAVANSFDRSGRLFGSRTSMIELVELNLGSAMSVEYGVVCLIKLPEAIYEKA